jgi:methylenetetrahydrofolate reductase (NADPH)
MIATSPAPGTRSLADAIAAGEWVVTATLPDDESTAADLSRHAAALRGAVTAVIVEERPGVARALAPTHRAHILREAGLGVIVALSGRDRNRVALEGELVALAHIGVDAVLVHPADDPLLVSGRAPAPPVDDLDEDALATLARRGGHVTAVAAPAGASTETLAARVADGCTGPIFVPAADADEIAMLDAGLAALGLSIPLIVRIPGPLTAAEAARLARDVAAVPGVAGVQVTVAAGATGDDAVRALAEVAAGVAAAGPTMRDARA